MGVFYRLLTVLVVLSLAMKAAYAGEASAHAIRKLRLKRDDIAQVKTSLGIATLIQVPDRPSSVVLGDTSAFKVEYLENAITIKPLSRTSKSNLYIYTDNRRFNVSLITVVQPQADYIVYLEPEVSYPKAQETWRNYHVSRSNADFNFEVEQIGQNQDLTLISFRISSKKSFRFRPEWIWLTQWKRTIPIQDLNLSGVELDQKRSIHGFISIRKSDLKLNSPSYLEVRSSQVVRIELPGVGAWAK